MSEKPGAILARGVCRALIALGHAPIVEFTPARGLRTDVTSLAPDGEIWTVECKSSVEDYRSDQKWRGYLDWCDRFYFAVPAAFPQEILPEEGLMIADGYDAEILRPAQARKLPAARRKAQTARIARAGLLRLRGLVDPGVAALVERQDEAG